MTLRAVRLAQTLRYWLRFERLNLQWWPVDRISADAADHVRWLAPLTIDGQIRAALFAHPPADVTYRIEMTRGDRCRADATLMPAVWNRNLGGVEFSLTLRSEDGQVVEEVRRRVDPGTRPEHRAWVPLSVRLSNAERAATVTLGTRLPDWYAGDNAWAVWGGPLVERRRSSSDRRALVRLALDEARAIGLQAALKRTKWGAGSDTWMPEYHQWAARRARHIASASRTPPAWQPLVSILTPVYNTPPDLLRACASSVLAQTYSNWEWCVCDDGSTSAATRAALAELTDRRIRVMTLPANAGIAGASQAALEAAAGEFVAFLDHDDELTPDALECMVRHLNASPECDVLYSDEDKRDEGGTLSEPFFKPDWAPEHLLSNMYVCHFTVARKAAVERAGGFREGTSGAQDHDLMLRLMEQTDRIEHVPEVLYHWRRTPGSTALAPGEKQWAADVGRRAVEEHLARTGQAATVEPGKVPGFYRAHFQVLGDPRVAVVVVGNGEDEIQQCVQSVREHTAYANYQITQASRNCASVNAAVRSLPSDHVLVLDASLRPTETGWLEALIEYAQQPSIGAVGGSIAYPDGCFRHLGLVLGVEGGVARVLHRQLERHGYFGSAMGVRNYSAVSAECLMTRRDVFEALGGFDAGLPWSVADVDYCLEARGTGRRVVFTPYASLQIRPGAAPAPSPDASAIASLRQRWGRELDADPYYNRNLDPASAQYRLGSAAGST